MSQHGRLGEPGRARGEQQRGRIAGLALDDPGVRPGTGDELGRSERRPAGLRQLPAGDLLRRPDDDGGGPDTGELLGELIERALRVDGHDHGAHTEHGQVGDDEFGARRANEGDPVARPDAVGSEARPRPLRVSPAACRS